MKICIAGGSLSPPATLPTPSRKLTAGLAVVTVLIAKWFPEFEAEGLALSEAGAIALMCEALERRGGMARWEIFSFAIGEYCALKELERRAASGDLDAARHLEEIQEGTV